MSEVTKEGTINNVYAGDRIVVVSILNKKS